MRSKISNFCEKRGIPKNMRDAFAAYARGVYADRYDIRRDTDTVRLMINNSDEEQIEEIWIEFVRDFRNILPSSQ